MADLLPRLRAFLSSRHVCEVCGHVGPSRFWLLSALRDGRRHEVAEHPGVFRG